MAAPNPKKDSVENLFILLKHLETPLLTSLRELRFYSAADCPSAEEPPGVRVGRKSQSQRGGPSEGRIGKVTHNALTIR